MNYFSPAKLNLFFRLLRRRDDGYHDIATLMQVIDFGDWLFLEKASKDRFTCSDPLLAHDDNLVCRAHALFRDFYPCPPLHIHLEKRIPREAGLGGGSSNAATALWALNEWTGSPASLSQLSSMGASLGSDVPFFFSTGSAYCTQRGECVTPVTLPRWDGVLIKPSYGLSTREVYQHSTPDACPHTDPQHTLTDFVKGTPHFYNDLESAAFKIKPELLSFKKALGTYFQTVSMTGSGTTFFCMGDEFLLEQVCREQAAIAFSTPFRFKQRDCGRWYS